MSRQVGLGVKDIVHQYLYTNDNPMRELWFIATLFWFFLLTPFWKAVLRKQWMMWLTLIVLIAFHFWHPHIELLCIGRVFYFAIWFYLGLVIKKTEFVDKVLGKYTLLTLFLGTAIYILGYYTTPFITTLGGITTSFAIAQMADKYFPRLFYSFRNFTYQIFLMGIFAQMLVKIVYRHVNWPYLPTYVLCIAVGLYVPVFISKIVEKINWRPLSLCMGLKTR